MLSSRVHRQRLAAVQELLEMQVLLKRRLSVLVLMILAGYYIEKKEVNAHKI
jgi:hypothetical protein